MKTVLVPLFLFFFAALRGQDPYDVLGYRYEIELSDQSDTIYGKATVHARFLSESAVLSLDLGLVNEKGKGMQVEKITGPGVNKFEKKNDKLTIGFVPAKKMGDTVVFIILYKGIPSDGLIISKNKFGNRTFFADNWPNRAHHWIPCKDDPSDKATVAFIVTAPDHYQVVSNGLQVEETNLPNQKKLTHWKEDVPLPTKVMVIGVADFAVGLAGYMNCIPVTSWIYPQEKQNGFYDYALALDILSFFSDYIGPYPYKKLANVQSKTIFGGMENANAIFYSENSVKGNRDSEGLIAHEIVHQWFGNMATEKHFAHLWLSEGFASYLTHVYMESKYGTERLINGMKQDRQQVIHFAKTSGKPVVDHTSPFMQLLNTNSYQKGSWVLHMLRRNLGDSVFRKIIRNYYEQYKGKNADTKDFQAMAEQISKKDLGKFFDQWLYKGIIPRLQIMWKYNAKQKNLSITIIQQTEPFVFPLEFSIREGQSAPRKITCRVNKAVETFNFRVNSRPSTLTADPFVSLLYEGVLTEQK